MKDDFYIFSGGKNYYVNREIYSAINQMNNRTYYLRHEADQCHATGKQRTRCESDCNSCPGYVNQEETLDNTWLIPGSREPSLEDIAACTEILDAMQEIDPDGRRIGQLYLSGCRDADIARILRISTSAFYRRKRKIKHQLHKRLTKDCG